LKKSQLGNEPKTIENIKPFRLIGVTNNWFVWIEHEATNDREATIKAIIKAYNLQTKQTKNLGSYEFNGCNYVEPDVVCFNSIIAWSALSQDTGYDIYFAKLPEGK
jgi:hypothetical protein